MTARLGKSSSRPDTCRYCGMETRGGGNHSCELECVEALTAEVEKARRLLASDKPGTAQGCLTTGIDKRTSDGGLSPPAPGWAAKSH